MEGQADSASHGVFVLGMHRSGTSATMQALTRLGLAACRPDDFIPGLHGNPRGHYESATLMSINEDLLHRAGGFWWAPPADERLMSAGRDPAFRNDARTRFLAAHATEEWVCKDPRCCLTLPFWTETLAIEPIVIAVSRSPVEVASSLVKRDEADRRVALAVWERYTRAMVYNMVGRRVFLSDYNELLDDPVTWCETAHSFLVGAGLTLPTLDRAAAAEAIDSGLRHRRVDQEDLARDPDVTDAQRRLYELVGALAGTSGSFPLVELPDDDGWMDREFRRSRTLSFRLRARLNRRRRARVATR